MSPIGCPSPPPPLDQLAFGSALCSGLSTQMYKRGTSAFATKLEWCGVMVWKVSVWMVSVWWSEWCLCDGLNCVCATFSVWKVSGRCLWYGLEGVCGMACKESVVWSGRCLWYGLEGICGILWKVSVVWSGRCLWYGLEVSVVWSGRHLWYIVEGVCGMVWKVSVVWSGRCLCGGLKVVWVMVWTALCGYLTGAVWVFDRRCMGIWPPLCGYLTGAVWVFDRCCVGIWTALCGYLKGAVWVFERCYVVIWPVLCGGQKAVYAVILTALCAVWQATDQSYVDKLNANFAKNQYFTKSPQTNKPVFSINHYAGKVITLPSFWNKAK